MKQKFLEKQRKMQLEEIRIQHMLAKQLLGITEMNGESSVV